MDKKNKTLALSDRVKLFDDKKVWFVYSIMSVESVYTGKSVQYGVESFSLFGSSSNVLINKVIKLDQVEKIF